jgi:hypothetical protein
VTLAPAAAAQLIDVDPFDRVSSWRAIFRGDTLEAIGAPATTAAIAGRVLVLLDVSGSMKGPKIGAARLVVRQFLGSLDSLPEGSIRVAVAPFGSVAVARRIGAARFEPPDSAVRAIRALPAPDRENTALFSAVTLATHRLNDEVARAGATGVGLLVVITDGNNDVRGGDDAGLLAGASGLAEASRVVAESPVAVAILGIGDLDMGALERLAGPRGRVFPVVARPSVFDLASPLGRATGVLQTSWVVSLPLRGTTRATLARGMEVADLRFDLGGDLLPAGTAQWRAPMVALPAFAGVVPPALAPGVDDGSRRRAWIGPALLGGVLLVLMLEVWIAVPRLIWRGGPGPATAPVSMPAAVTRTGPLQPPVAAPTPSPAAGHPIPLRGDLTEIPPRKPSEITAARARSI